MTIVAAKFSKGSLDVFGMLCCEVPNMSHSNLAEAGARALGTFTAHCLEAGLDVVHPFALDAFNGTAPEQERLPDFGRHALAVVVGNTRFFWDRFLDTLESEPERHADSDPLDRYVEERVRGACESLPIRATAFWAHVTHPRVVPIQRIAQVAGLASLAPSHFSIHPVYGPWLALRAIVVFDVDGPTELPTVRAGPCAHCSEPCMPPLRDALAHAERDSVPLALAIRNDWRAWARVRQVCPVGQAEKYSDAQTEYHYTKNKKCLLRQNS